MYFFQASRLFSIENAKFWPLLANFSYFVVNLCTFLILRWCTKIDKSQVWLVGGGWISPTQSLLSENFACRQTLLLNKNAKTMDGSHLYPAENTNDVPTSSVIHQISQEWNSTFFIGTTTVQESTYSRTLLGDLNQHIIVIIITNTIVITILQKVRVSFMFRDHYRPNPFLPQLRASYFHPRILFSSFACL